jgi:hypothetical protein
LPEKTREVAIDRCGGSSLLVKSRRVAHWMGAMIAAEPLGVLPTIGKSVQKWPLAVWQRPRAVLTVQVDRGELTTPRGSGSSPLAVTVCFSVYRRGVSDMATKAKEAAAAAAPAERPVIVCTEHRGVFFGYATETGGEVIALKRARNCVYWSADCKGFVGLAANGPTKSCRVGPAADMELRAITAVLEVSPAAVEAWEKAPWQS